MDRNFFMVKEEIHSVQNVEKIILKFYIFGPYIVYTYFIFAFIHSFFFVFFLNFNASM